MPDPISIATGGLFSGDGISLVTQGLFSVAGDSNLHPRTLIRRYVVAKLKAAASEVADRVHSERVEPIQAREAEWDLPALNIFTRDETAEEWAKSPRTLKRDVEVAIDIIDGGRDVEDHIDEIAKWIERIIGSDIRLGQNADDVILRSTETSFDGAGAKKFGVARLIFVATYGTEVSIEPGDQLLRIHNEWNFTVPDAQKEAEDDITFEET